MLNIIQGDPELLSMYTAGDDSDLLDALNTPTEKVLTKHPVQSDAGFVNLATMGDLLGDTALGTFQLVIRESIDAQIALGTPTAKATAENMEGFLSRFRNTLHGINMADDRIRSTVQYLLTTAGVDPAPYLALGYTLTSLAQQHLGRDATQADIDQARNEEAANAIEPELNSALNEVNAGDNAAAVTRLQAVITTLGG